MCEYLLCANHCVLGKRRRERPPGEKQDRQKEGERERERERDRDKEREKECVEVFTVETGEASEREQVRVRLMAGKDDTRKRRQQEK